MNNEMLQEQLKVHKNKSKMIGVLVFCLLTSFLGFLIGLKIGTPKNENAAVTKVLNILENEWYSEIYYDSYKDAPIAQFISSVANLDSSKQLDPYTYLIKRSTGQGGTTTSKEYGKLGIKIQSLFNSNFQFIKTVYPNSPAKKAGLLPYDVIYGVKLTDGTMITDDYENYFQQEVNHSMTLLIKRYEQNSNTFESIEVPVTFERYSYPSAYQLETTLADTLYVKIDEFNSDITGINTVDEVEKIFKNNQDCKYLILDLINNGGGAVDSLVEICDLFLPAKKLISTMEVKDKSKTKYKTKDKTVYHFDHIFIYMNGNTASASEMLIGCLKYYFDNLTLIGTNTFGKGIAQRTINISPQYDFQYTFAKWFTPDNQWIHEKGFAPTEESDYMLYSSNYQQYLMTSLDKNLCLKKDMVDTKNLIALQKLYNAVFDGNVRVDGYFDDKLETFVKQLQSMYNLEPTGIIDYDFILNLALDFAKESYKYDMQYEVRVHTIIQEIAGAMI